MNEKKYNSGKKSVLTMGSVISQNRLSISITSLPHEQSDFVIKNASQLLTDFSTQNKIDDDKSQLLEQAQLDAVRNAPNSKMKKYLEAIGKMSVAELSQEQGFLITLTAACKNAIENANIASEKSSRDVIHAIIEQEQRRLKDSAAPATSAPESQAFKKQRERYDPFSERGSGNFLSFSSPISSAGGGVGVSATGSTPSRSLPDLDGNGGNCE
jgi:hypothetical protein